MRIRSSFAALIAAALVLVGALPVFATAEEPPAGGDSEHAVALAPVEPGLVAAAAQPVLSDAKTALELLVLRTNAGDRPLAGGELQVELSEAPVESLRTLADPADVAYAPLTSLSVDEVAPASENQRTIEVPAADLPFAAAAAGPVVGTVTAVPRGTYLVRVSFVPSGESAPTLTSVTPIVWQGGAEPPATTTPTTVPLSIVVPFVLPETITSMPTRAQLTDLAPAWDQLLTAAEATRATLAIDPRIIASIRGYGSRAPVAAQELLIRLEASTAESFLLQFADADVAAQAALGFTSLVRPTSLEFLTRHGSFLPTDPDPDAEQNGAADASAAHPGAAAGNSQEAAPDSNSKDAPTSGANSIDDANASSDSPDGTLDGQDEPPVPELSQLISWHGDTAVWPAEGNVGQSTIDLVEAEHITTFFLDSSNVTHSGGPLVELPKGQAVVTNADLSQAATAALTGTTEVERAAGLAELTAQLAVRAQTAPTTGVVLGLNRAAVADSPDPASLLEAVQELNFVRATRVPDQNRGTGALKEAGPLEQRLALLSTASDREASVNAVGAVLIHPQYLSGYQRTRLLSLFATRYASADSGFDAVASEFRARDAELLEGVQAVSTEHTQLVGVETNVPVQLHNSLPFDARVTVTAEPTSPAIHLSQRVFLDVHVEAEANERVLIPVHSRVSSGTSGLVVTVSATGGTPIVYTGTLELTISSIVETVALWLLGTSAAVLLILGVIRSVRQHQTGKRHTGMIPVQSRME